MRSSGSTGVRRRADLLSRAETAAPDNAAVLAAQGRLHAAAGHPDLALAYYERALTIDPAAAARARAAAGAAARACAPRRARVLLRALQRRHAGPAGGIRLGERSSERAVPRLGNGAAREEVLCRARPVAARGIEWRSGPSVRVRAGVLFGGDAQVLPQTDGYGGIDYQRGRATWSFDLRFAEFQDADVQIGGAGLALALAAADPRPGSSTTASPPTTTSASPTSSIRGCSACRAGRIRAGCSASSTRVVPIISRC